MDVMSGVAVAKVILDQLEIVAPIRECEAARVPEHVRMDRREFRARRRGRDQVIDGLTRERLAAFLHPEVVFHSAVTNIVGETVSGRDAILGLLDRWAEDWSSIRWEVDEYIDAGEDRVVTLHRVIAKGRSSGIELDRELGGVRGLRLVTLRAARERPLDARLRLVVGEHEDLGLVR